MENQNEEKKIKKQLMEDKKFLKVLLKSGMITNNEYKRGMKRIETKLKDVKRIL